MKMPIREKSIIEKDARLKLNEISGLSSIETNEVLVCEKEDLQKVPSQVALFELHEKSVTY